MTNLLFFPGKNPNLIRAISALPGIEASQADSIEELRAALPAAEVLVTSNRVYEPDAAQEIRKAGKRLRWIQFTTSGIDKAIANGLPDGIPVTNASGSHAKRVAEHALSLLLAVGRQHNAAAAARPQQTWVRDEIGPQAISLERKTLLIIGVGAIGQDIARKAKAFDMHVVGISRSAEQLPNIDELRPREELHAALAQADAVVIAATYDASTHHLIDAAAFAAMKPTAVLVNIARGLMIDEAAMIEALKARKIAGVGLDVTATEPLTAGSPLWDLPNLVLTPHIAGAGGDPTDAIIEIIRDNYARFQAGEPLAKLSYGPKHAPA